ncbi:MAG: adenosine deaminase [Candidatus Aminicenantes bacterium]|nr:adenosine deaminase [Candidatus Aminicenantes bacterium]
MDRAFLERMPKVELHVHLEGAIPIGSLRLLAEKYGRDLDADPGWAVLRDRAFRGFPDFVAAWRLISGCLREAEDYRLIAGAVARDLIRQGIRYAEVLFSPTLDAVKPLGPQRIVEAVAAGFAPHCGMLTIRLVADAVRDNGPAEALGLAEALAEMDHPLVAGMGLGGSEVDHPPAPFAPAFERARRAGLRTEAHAGETAGPESIRKALDSLRVDRISHGVRAASDPALIDRLARERIPLAMCPTSNLRLGAVARIEDHPAAAFLRRGLCVSLATDDPAVFGCDLPGEFALLDAAFGLIEDEVRRLSRNAVEAAWCGDADKARLRTEIDSFFAAGQAFPGRA